MATEPDLDALAALLAAATAAKGDGRWRDENTKVNAQMDYLTAVHDPDVIISLIEAARREAALREALAAEEARVADQSQCTLDGQMYRIGVMEAVRNIRALLHDNAGASERGAE